MKRFLIVACLVAVWMVVAASGQTNARLSSIGEPGLDSASFVDDVSNVFIFPSEVAKSTDMAQGVSGANGTGYVYAAKNVSGPLSVALLFNRGGYIGAGNFSAGITSAMNNAITQLNTATPGNQGTAWSNAIDTNVTPFNSGHLLLGLNLSSSLKLGFDLFREASNSSSDYTDFDGTLTPAQTTTTNSYKNIGSKGVTVGAELGISSLSLKASFAYILQSYDAEWKQNVTGGPRPYTSPEKATFKSTSGYYMPIYANLSTKMATHQFSLIANILFSGNQFEATYQIPSTTTTTSYKSADYSTLSMGIGLGDIYQVAANTNIFASLTINRKSTTSTPDTKTDAIREVTNYYYTFPKTTLGIEHVMANIWKFDQIAIRAGGAKSYTWSSKHEEGGNTKHDDSQPATVSAFQWMTGVGFTVGTFQLDLAMLPDEWNGVYLLSGAGPEGLAELVTLTYNFGASK